MVSVAARSSPTSKPCAFKRVLAVSVRSNHECAARRPRHRRGPLGMSLSQQRPAADVVQAVCGAAAAFSFAADAA